MHLLDELKKEEKLPVVIADERGVIVYVNNAFEQIFLWSFDEIIGQPLTAIIPTELHDAHNLGFSRFITTGKSVILNQHLALTAITKNGVKFKAMHFIRSEQIDGQWIFGATIEPMKT